MLKMKIYISGPITGTDDYKERFQRAQEDLKNTYEYGMIVNPAGISEIFSKPEQVSHEDYMHISLAILDKCDCIHMLAGWEKSQGACIEYGYAKAKKMLITFEEEHKNE
jgi:hypothetical protein|nr:MAG TPA: Nucleoside deoxyribosyltransferase [Caudoviricetes sp.]DAV07791.1 MAG TPA: Nucleoside deoxyribosyltransferase [Caudoviricetes sp.]